MFICDRGTGAQQFRGLVMTEIHRWRPRRYKFEFHLSGMIADHRRNLGRVGKIETLPILHICPRPSQTIGDIYDFEFSLVGIIWDSWETVKSPIIWDFPDMWKPGLKIQYNIHHYFYYLKKEIVGGIRILFLPNHIEQSCSCMLADSRLQASPWWLVEL